VVSVFDIKDGRCGLCLPEPQQALDLLVVGDGALEELSLSGRDDAVAVSV
jgi:hypothetical protein